MVGVHFFILWVIINAVKFVGNKKPTHPVIGTILFALGSWPETMQRTTKRQIIDPCLAEVDMVLIISHWRLFLYGEI